MNRPFLFALAALMFIVTADESAPGKLSFYAPNWDRWDEHVARWSMHEAPTFSMVFKPETVDELSQGVSVAPFHPCTHILPSYHDLSTNHPPTK